MTALNSKTRNDLSDCFMIVHLGGGRSKVLPQAFLVKENYVLSTT